VGRGLTWAHVPVKCRLLLLMLRILLGQLTGINLVRAQAHIYCLNMLTFRFRKEYPQPKYSALQLGPEQFNILCQLVYSNQSSRFNLISSHEINIDRQCKSRVLWSCLRASASTPSTTVAARWNGTTTTQAGQQERNHVLGPRTEVTQATALTPCQLRLPPAELRILTNASNPSFLPWQQFGVVTPSRRAIPIP